MRKYLFIIKVFWFIDIQFLPCSKNSLNAIGCQAINFKNKRKRVNLTKAKKKPTNKLYLMRNKYKCHVKKQKFEN